MSRNMPTIDFKVTEEEKQYLITERERKEKEEKAIQENLRIGRNGAAVETAKILQDSIRALKDSILTLDTELADRTAEIEAGDTLWRRGEHEDGVEEKARLGFAAATNLRQLCSAVQIGMDALTVVALLGVRNVDGDGSAKSATLMATSRAYPQAVGSRVVGSLGRISKIVSEVVKPVEEVTEVRDVKRKRF